MSVIVAVKGDGCVYLAADSQATNGSSRLTLDEKHGKLRQITPQLAVGCTRSMAQIQCLMDFNDAGLSSLLDVAHHVHAKVSYQLAKHNLMEKSKNTGAEELPGTLLVAWKDDFVEVGADASLIKPAAPWHAIGSGAEVARGALWVWGNSLVFDAIAAEAAVRAACELDTYCSEPIITAVTRS